MNKSKYQISNIKYQISNWKFEIPVKQAGFTLIEVLVTLSLVGLIAGLIITSTTAIGRRNRDQQRITNLQNIQSAIGQYYADQQFYPDSNIAAGSNLRNPTGTITYLQSMPKDPQANAPQQYCFHPQLSATDTGSCSSTGTPCQFYYLCAHLENAPTAPSTACATACGSVNYNFEVNPNKSF